MPITEENFVRHNSQSIITTVGAIENDAGLPGSIYVDMDYETAACFCYSTVFPNRNTENFVFCLLFIFDNVHV